MPIIGHKFFNFFSLETSVMELEPREAAIFKAAPELIVRPVGGAVFKAAVPSRKAKNKSLVLLININSVQ